MPAARIFLQLIADFVVYLGLLIRPRKAIAAENLFLRRQLALYQERKVDPRRIDPATRITLALLSRFFNWRDALIVVQPKTLIRWHRAGFRLLWHWKSKPGPAPLRPHRHPLSASRAVVAKPVLNGLHHDYRLAPCST